MPGALPADVRQRTGLLQRPAAGCRRGNHDRVAQLGELEELPAVERHLLDLAGLDDVADLGGGRLQQRRADLDRHRLAESARSTA